VFILKRVKVVCFDTLLQVLILKDLWGSRKSKSETGKWLGIGEQMAATVGQEKNRRGW